MNDSRAPGATYLTLLRSPSRTYEHVGTLCSIHLRWFAPTSPGFVSGGITESPNTSHSWIYLEVKNDQGQPTVWALEATNPLGLQRKGIKREDVRTGDTIKVRCHLLRDGSNGCLLGYVTPTHGDPARGHGVEKEWD
jgi:hypothetical protein